MAAYGMGVVVAPILGPTLGGWVTEVYTWRWVFYINLPVGALAFLMVQAFVEDPPYIKGRRPGRIDFLGFALMAVGLATLQIMLDKGQEDDWFAAPWVRWAAAITAVSLTAFIARELTTEHPIVDLRILQNRNFAVGTVLITVLGIVLYSTIAMLPLFLQTLMGYSALKSGLTITPRGMGAFLTNLIVGQRNRLRGYPTPDRRRADRAGVVRTHVQPPESRHRHAERGMAELPERDWRFAHLRLPDDHGHGAAQKRATRECGRHL